jgi:hypothetical protein
VPTYRIAGGIVLVLIGVTALLPWLLEWVVRRTRAGAVPLQLAVRRLQRDSGTAARAVSGITIAVAGAAAGLGAGLIALVTLLSMPALWRMMRRRGCARSEPPGSGVAVVI